MGKIDTTLFIKSKNNDMLSVQIYYERYYLWCYKCFNL